MCCCFFVYSVVYSITQSASVISKAHYLKRKFLYLKRFAISNKCLSLLTISNQAHLKNDRYLELRCLELFANSNKLFGSKSRSWFEKMVLKSRLLGLSAIRRTIKMIICYSIMHFDFLCRKTSWFSFWVDHHFCDTKVQSMRHFPQSRNLLSVPWADVDCNLLYDLSFFFLDKQVLQYTQSNANILFSLSSQYLKP